MAKKYFYVPQSPFISDDTIIKNNIAYAKVKNYFLEILDKYKD